MGGTFSIGEEDEPSCEQQRDALLREARPPDGPSHETDRDETRSYKQEAENTVNFEGKCQHSTFEKMATFGSADNKPVTSDGKGVN